MTDAAIPLAPHADVRETPAWRGAREGRVGGMMATVAELVSAAKQRIENLDVEQVASEQGGGVLLVDLREPQELVDSGCIPGSVHAPRGMLEFYADPSSPYHREELKPERRVILYCASGGRSALAAAALHELGYADVAHLDGGFRAWTEAGLPVERSS